METKSHPKTGANGLTEPSSTTGRATKLQLSNLATNGVEADAEAETPTQ